MAFGKRASMAYTDDEKGDRMMPIPMPDVPEYPPGLKIVLTETELSKIEDLGVDCECEVGDVIDLRVFCCVTHESSESGADGKRRRIELQIEDVLMFEDETTEEPGEE